jgi:hypothetical protein
MKEILEKILLYLPQFLSDCGSIIVEPKTFVLKKVKSKTLFESKEYFLFLALSIAIITIISMLYPIHGEIYTTLAKNLVLIFIGFIGYSFAVRGAFWVVGGRAPYEKFFSVSTYISSPMLLINYMIGLISNGIFRLLDPDAYDALSKSSSFNARSQIISNSSAANVFYIFVAIGFGLIVLWSYICWGAFREINQLSRIRSFVAFVLAWIFAQPVFVLLILIAFAVAPPEGVGAFAGILCRPLPGDGEGSSRRPDCDRCRRSGRRDD